VGELDECVFQRGVFCDGKGKGPERRVCMPPCGSGEEPDSKRCYGSLKVGERLSEGLKALG
jgi:hypothetical protein